MNLERREKLRLGSYIGYSLAYLWRLSLGYWDDGPGGEHGPRRGLGTRLWLSPTLRGGKRLFLSSPDRRLCRRAIQAKRLFLY